MPRTFGKYRELQTAKEAYADGYSTGLNWSYNYQPGGPWVCFVGSSYIDADWVSWAEATAENNAAWRQGFSVARNAVAK